MRYMRTGTSPTGKKAYNKEATIVLLGQAMLLDTKSAGRLPLPSELEDKDGVLWIAQADYANRGVNLTKKIGLREGDPSTVTSFIPLGAFETILL